MSRRPLADSRTRKISAPASNLKISVNLVLRPTHIYVNWLLSVRANRLPAKASFEDFNSKLLMDQV